MKALKILLLVVFNLAMVTPLYLCREELSTRAPIELIIVLPMIAMVMFVLNVPVVMWWNDKFE